MSWLFVFVCSTILIGLGCQTNDYFKNLNVEAIAISSESGLKNMSMSGNYTLTQDIEVNNWVPLDGFTGTFNGGGHKITIKSLGEHRGQGGLFAYTNGATIENVFVKWVEDVEIEPFGHTMRFGGIVGNASNTTIQNCYVEADAPNMLGAMAGPFAGGIVGLAHGGEIVNCAHKGTIATASDSGVSIGGIVGGSMTTPTKITNCYHDGNLAGGTIDGISNWGESILTDNFSIGENAVVNTNAVTKNWSTEIWGGIGTNYPYLRAFFADYSITYQTGTGVEDSVVRYYKENTDVEIVGNEFDFTNGKMEFIGWKLEGTDIIYNAGDTMSLNSNKILVAQWKANECVIKFNINTDIGIILLIRDDEGNSSQVFVNKVTQYDDLQPTFTTNFVANKTYTIIISTYYTSQINFVDSSGQVDYISPSGQELQGNKLTLTASEDMIVRIKVSAFNGNNGIII